MNEQTTTKVNQSTTTDGGSRWINIWRCRVHPEERRGLMEHPSQEAALKRAREWIAENPDSAWDHVGAMPKEEWTGL